MRTILTLPLFLFSLSSFAQVTLMEFTIISQAFYHQFSEELSKRKEALFINPAPNPKSPNFWWDLDTVHASYTSSNSKEGIKEHNLYLFGGFARMDGMTPDGVALTLCHELGHGIGGAPMKKKGPYESPASTEGQSDYYATRYCLKRIFKVLPESYPVEAPNAFTENLCHKYFSSKESIKLCHRGFQALEVDMIFLRTQIIDGSDINFDIPDPTIVNEVNLSPTFYPSPQCRLDTMVAGILEQERPRCWWAP